MGVIIAASIVLALAVVACAMLWPWLRLANKVVRVELDTGQTVEGRVKSRVWPALVLTDVSVFTVTGDAVSTQSRFTIPYRQLVWIQEQPPVRAASEDRAPV